MIAERLQYWAKKDPQKIALQMKLQESYEKITYLDLWNLALHAASLLRVSGVNPRQHVALYAENTPGWAVSYLGVHILGGVVIPLDAQLSARDILPLIRFSNTRAIIADTNHLTELQPLLTGPLSEFQLFPVESLIIRREETTELYPYVHSPDDLMSILFTSGTTGTPKGVELTCKNIFSNIEAVLSQIEVSAKDNVLNILPLHHSFSCTVGLLAALVAGATVTFSYSLKSTDLLAAMRETGVTIFPGVPKLFTLLDREIFKKVDALSLAPRILFWSLYLISKWLREKTGTRLGRLLFKQIHDPFGERLRFFASGGAKLDANVSERFLNLGFLILEGYGLTETSPVISITPPGKPKPGSAGRPIPGVEVRIDSPDSEGMGEICICGPNVMKGYYENESGTKEVLRDGWLHTGDLGMIDPEGNIVITGRTKEIIVLSSGKNIHPEEVEKHYENMEFLKEICVLPSMTDKGEVRGLRMVAVPDLNLISTRGVLNTRDRIRSEIASIGSRLPSYMQITELVLFYDELPRTRLGKLRRGEVEKLISKQKNPLGEEKVTLSPEEKALIEAPVSVRFLKRLEEIGDVKGPFAPHQDLSIDLGLDSLTLVEITVLLENEFGVKLTEEELPFVRTIGDVLERLQIVNEQSHASTSGPTPGPNGLPSNELHSRYIGEENESSVKALFQGPPETALDNVFNLERGMTKRLIMRTLKGVISVIVRAAFRVRINGLGKIPKKGAVLLCPNHQSYIDPLVIFAILPGWMLDRLMFVALGEIFGRPPLSWLKHPTRIIPTGSAGTLGESLKLSHEGLKRGMSVCIFPEGGRTTTGKIMDPRPGAGILSVETGTPIVPILIEGAINTLSHLNPQFKFAKVQIIIGDPIYPVIERDNMRMRYEYMMDKWKEALLEIESRSSKI